MAAYTTIDDPSAYFKIQLYSGTGSSNAQTFADTDTDMQPDLVWVKSRTYADHHMIADAARGATKQLYVNQPWVEETQAEGLKSFDSDGFTVGTRNNWNRSSQTFAAWCWNTQGGAGSSNTDGSIDTTTTSVGTTQGFSISTYTGTGSASTVGHGLGVVPKVIIVKKLNAEEDWTVLNMNLSGEAEKYLVLNTDGSVQDSSTTFNDTDPTSTVFSVNTAGSTNGSGATYVAYCWANVQGFSRFGSYEGTGNADGPFVYTGFRPALVIIKNVDGSSMSWTMRGNGLNPFNPADGNVVPNTAATEASGKDIDILSNGFKARTTDGGVNGSGNTHVYMAWAEAPFVNSNGVPCNAR